MARVDCIAEIDAGEDGEDISLPERDQQAPVCVPARAFGACNRTGSRLMVTIVPQCS